MNPTRTPARVLIALAALLLLSPLLQAQEDGERLMIEMTDFSKSEFLQAAAVVQPLPPRTLQRLLPESFAGLSQTDSKGKVDWLGPAGRTRVEAFYGEPGVGVKIVVLDPAGLPPEGREYMEELPVGDTRAFPRRERRGVRVGDFNATAETIEGTSFLRVQAFVGPRVRVGVESMADLTLDQLLAAMEKIELGAFAALAPDAPPDLSDLRAKPE